MGEHAGSTRHTPAHDRLDNGRTPGDSALDHAPDERIDLDEFDRAVDVLVSACEEVVA